MAIFLELYPTKKKKAAEEAAKQNDDIPSPTTSPTTLLSTAASYAFQHFYSKPYCPPPDDANDALKTAWSMDFHPVYNVHRPNHGMADALRKAMLVPHVLKAYLKNYETSTYFSGEFTKDAFGSMLPSEILAMQLAMIFEVAGRDSDIGFSDHPDTFHRFHRASCNAYKQFRSVTHENVRILYFAVVVFSHFLTYLFFSVIVDNLFRSMTKLAILCWNRWNECTWRQRLSALFRTSLSSRDATISICTVVTAKSE